MTLCYGRTQKKSNYWSSPPSRGFLSEKSIFMDGLGERVFTLLSSVNHFYWTFFQASSGQGAYTRTHFESDPSSSRQRDSHCGKREQSKGKRGECRQGEFQHESKCCYHTSVLSDWFTFDYSIKEAESTAFEERWLLFVDIELDSQKKEQKQRRCLPHRPLTIYPRSLSLRQRGSLFLEQARRYQDKILAEAEKEEEKEERTATITSLDELQLRPFVNEGIERPAKGSTAEFQDYETKSWD